MTEANAPEAKILRKVVASSKQFDLNESSFFFFFEMKLRRPSIGIFISSMYSLDQRNTQEPKSRLTSDHGLILCFDQQR